MALGGASSPFWKQSEEIVQVVVMSVISRAINTVFWLVVVAGIFCAAASMKMNREKLHFRKVTTGGRAVA